MITILIIARNNEDHESIISAISKHSGLKIIGIENNEADAVLKTEKLKPDALIMDLPPPGITGAEIAPIMRRRSPSTAIIEIDNYDESDHADNLLKAGVLGYVDKKSDMDKLPLALRTVCSGCYFMSPFAVSAVNETFSLIKQAYEEIIGKAIELRRKWLENEKTSGLLTAIEEEIINEMVLGCSDNEIAAHLNYSKGTVRNYLNIIKQKANLKNRVQIGIFSVFYGLADAK